MASSVIGALRVNLGIDSAQFTTGLKQANTHLGGFAKGLRKVLLPLAALGSATAIGNAIGSSFRNAINTADDMGKAAQKFGVGVEELSRLNYAAELADVSLEQLGTSMGKLSKNMVAASTGGKTAAQAFASVGVAFQNADGTLRSSSDVLRDLADRFAATPDGAEKTAAAMALMGKSGAEMIPLLNAGGASIAAMGDEAERAGLVISQEAAKAAEDFNDNLTRLSQAARGLAQRLAGALLPALADIVEMTLRIAQSWDKLPAVAAEIFDRCLQIVEAFVVGVRAAAADIPAAFVAAFQGIVHAAATALTAVPGSIGESLIQPLKDADAALSSLGTSGVEEFNTGMSNAAWLMKDALRPLESLPPVAEAATGAVTGVGASFEGMGEAAGGAAAKTSEAAKALEDLRQRAAGVFEETRTPMEQFQLQMLELNYMVQHGAIDWDTYNRAVIQAQDALKDAEDTGKTSMKNIGDDFGNMITGMIQGTTTFREAFASMLANIGGDLLSSGIGDAFTNIFKGITGGAGGGFKIPGFARGTNFAPGGLAMVGERGPELVNLPRGSQVTPNHELGRGGGGAVAVRVFVDQDGNWQAAVANIAGPVSAQVVQKMAPGVVANASKRAG